METNLFIVTQSLEITIKMLHQKYYQNHSQK